MVEMKEVVEMQAETIGLLEERLAEIELALEDEGWNSQNALSTDREFSRTAIGEMVRRCRSYYFSSPLIGHSVRVQAHYVFGQGVNVHVSEDDDSNVKIQEWMNDSRNQKSLFGHRARVKLERDLQVTGNVFICMNTNPDEPIRVCQFEEIVDIICNPVDRDEKWFYIKNEVTRGIGSQSDKVELVAHPDIDYEPDVRIPNVGDGGNKIPIMWDQPILHITGDELSDQRFGTPEIWSAISWAKAVQSDLQSYATIRNAHARFAWKMTGLKGGAAAVAAAKTKLGTTLGLDTSESNPPPLTGATYIQSGEGRSMEPFKTAGMQPSPDEGRRLWLMTAAGVGLPETIMTGDADVGNLATAKTLDRPTELKMVSRQALWGMAYKQLIYWRSVVGRFSITGTVHIDFPSILERDVINRVRAVVSAVTLNGRPNTTMFDDRTIMRLLLTALGEDTIGELMDTLAPAPGVKTPAMAPQRPSQVGAPAGGFGSVPMA